MILNLPPEKFNQTIIQTHQSSAVMLFHLFEFLRKNYPEIPGVELFKFISFRAGVAVILSLIISLWFGGRIVRWLQSLQISDAQRQLGLAGENLKAGTPTMGGIIIILATLVPCLLLANLSNIYIVLMLVSMTWLSIIGFADDYIKVFRKDKKGLKSIFKVLGQVGLGLIVGITILVNREITVRLPEAVAIENGYEIIDSQKKVKVKVKESERAIYGGADSIWHVRAKAPITNVPFLKNNELDYSKILGDNLLWLVFVVMTVLVITAVSNGANLTDGLDGLCAGVSGIVIAALGVFAYVSGNAVAAEFLNIMFIPDTGELGIFAACLLGGCLGFLWYNVFPARVFMGDTGSLMLGGIIAAMAIVLRKELLIPVLCGVFLIENLSVMIQVWWFKRTKKKYGEGRRIFLMSPLHHHYQKKGLHEATITARFWIVQILLAVFTVITLKIR